MNAIKRAAMEPGGVGYLGQGLATATHTMPLGSRSNPVTGVARAAVRAAALLEAVGMLATGRVLLLEPPSATLGQALRQCGFRGSCWVLARQLRGHMRAEGLYDHVEILAWPNLVAQDQQSNARLRALGDPTFDAVIACGALSRVSAAHQDQLMRWLSSLLAPRGFLMLRDPAAAVTLMQGQVALADIGLVVVADEVFEATKRRHQLVTLQHRGRDECRHSGAARRVTLEQISGDAALCRDLVATF